MADLQRRKRMGRAIGRSVIYDDRFEGAASQGLGDLFDQGTEGDNLVAGGDDDADVGMRGHGEFSNREASAVCQTA